VQIYQKSCETFFETISSAEDEKLENSKKNQKLVLDLNGKLEAVKNEKMSY
jgi:hypothetical protein